jgi:hypothetical protein
MKRTLHPNALRGASTDLAAARVLLDFAVGLLTYAAERWYGDSNGTQLWLTHIAQGYYALALRLGLDVSGQLDFTYAQASVRYGCARARLLPHLDHSGDVARYLDGDAEVLEVLAALARAGTTREERIRAVRTGARLVRRWTPSATYYLGMCCFVLAEAARIRDSAGHDPEEDAAFVVAYAANSVTASYRRMCVDYATFVLRTGARHGDRPPTARPGWDCDAAHFFLVLGNLALMGGEQSDEDVLAA